jgi:hypothetical protein
MKKQRIIIESIRYITGVQKSVRVRGKISEMVAFQNVLKASKKLYETLQRKDARLEEIEKLVVQKNKAAIRFRRATGNSWPL